MATTDVTTGKGEAFTKATLATTHIREDSADLDEFNGLVLADVITPLEKWWFQYPHLLKLNLTLLSAFLAQFTCGFDGSMINGMQSLPTWQAAFGNPVRLRPPPA